MPEDQVEQTPVKKAPVEKLPIGVMIAESSVRLGIASHDMAGALFGYDRDTIAVADAQKLAEAHLKREIPSGDEEE